MKKNLFYILAALLAFVAVACEQEYPPYEAAQVEEGAQFYFQATTPTLYTITATTTSFEIPIYRATKDEAAEAIVTVTDTSKTVFAEGVKDVKVAFAAGKQEAAVSLPIDYSKYAFKDLYGLTLKIKEQTTIYAPSELKIEIYLPEPWKSLGKTATYIDTYFGWEKPLTGIEIMQNELEPKRFRIMNPYKGAPQCTTNGYITLGGDPAPYFDFVLLQKGDVLAGVTITQDDLVYFDYDLIPYTYDDGSNKGQLEIDHPAAFSSLRSEDKWLHNKVLSYQENGLPAQIQWAPYYYISGLGGFNRTQYDGMVTITFPDVVIADYTIEMEFEGVLSKKDEPDVAMITLDYVGPDVKDVALVVVPGEDPTAALPLAEDVMVVEEAGVYKVAIPEGAPAGQYTVVAIPLADGEPQDKFAVYESFVYGDLSPLQLNYTGDALIEYVSKEKLFATEWAAYATDDEHTPVDREFYGMVTFEEAEDVAADSDRILAHGFTYGGAAYYKTFSDDLYMEWYKGMVYTLKNEAAGTYASGSYTVIPVYVSDDAESVTTDDYVMVAAYVDEGILAFVSAEDNVNFTQIWWGAISASTGNFAGYLTCMNYILLVDPDVVDVSADINTTVNRASKKLQRKENVRRYVDSLNKRNYVEINPSATATLHNAEVTASGRGLVRNTGFETIQK